MTGPALVYDGAVPNVYDGAVLVVPGGVYDGLDRGDDSGGGESVVTLSMWRGW